MKLGEALVKGGVITEEQLIRALQRQVICGGRIGTNIVESGMLEEREFTKFLSSYFKVPYVEPSELQAIDEETISCISREFAEKYKVIPLKREKKRLHIAMIQPRNNLIVDELRFMTGFDIIPYVTPEVRLLYCLEKYYGIKRELRFIKIEHEEEEAPKQIEPVEEMTKIKEAFSAVKDRDEVAGLLLKEAGKIAKRVSLFMVKENSVISWKATGINADGFQSQITSPSLFHELLTRRSYYRGPVLNIPQNKGLIGLLGGTPQDSLLVPISLRERVVAVLYADNGNLDVLDANIAYLNTLAQLASLSFELLIIKKKIMEL